MNLQDDKEVMKAIREFTGHAAQRRELIVMLICMSIIFVCIIASFFVFAKFLV